MKINLHLSNSDESLSLLCTDDMAYTNEGVKCDFCLLFEHLLVSILETRINLAIIEPKEIDER